jgi:hypothetical protein
VYDHRYQNHKWFFLDYCEMEELRAALEALPDQRRMRVAVLK